MIRPGLVTGIATATLAVGCSSPVAVESPALEGNSARLCSALAEEAPASVADAERRAVDTTGTALAWGDPPIVLTCGVPVPPELKPGARCDTIDKVDWFTRDGADGLVFATIGRATTVEVRVPDDYEPAGDALIDLGGAVRAAVPVVKRCL